MGTGFECPVTSTRAVFRGNDVFRRSSWVLNLASAEDNGVEGVSEEGSGSVGSGNGST